MSDEDDRTRITQALMALAAERAWDEIDLEALADRAGVTLAMLRTHFDGRPAVLAAFVRDIDVAVLAGRDSGLGGEPARERLFDLLFARLEALAPHRAALRNMARAAMGDPLLALALNGMNAQSMGWMLSAAGIPAGGLRGAARAQAMTLVWARVMRTFLDDASPDLATTMAELDKRLAEAERVALQANRIEDFFRRPLDVVRRRRPRRDLAADDFEPAPATAGTSEGLTA